MFVASLEGDSVYVCEFRGEGGSGYSKIEERKKISETVKQTAIQRRRETRQL